MSREPLWRRYRDLLRRDPIGDVDDEVRFHLEMREREARRAGKTADEARADARQRFGDVSGIVSELRSIDGRRERRRARGEWWFDVTQDVRVAWRALGRAPGFAVTAIATIAIAIAANTTVFSFVDSLLFERLPYGDAGSLAIVSGGVNGTLGEALALRERVRSFADLASYRPRSITLNDQGDPAQLDGESVTANLFPLLGVAPMIGAPFAVDADDPGKGRVIMLGYGLWRRRYGGDRGIVGRKLIVDGSPYFVSGVMPPTFQFPTARADFWVPMTIDRGSAVALWTTSGGSFVARLRRGASLASAQRELLAVAVGMRRLNPVWDPGANYGKDARLIPFRQHLVGKVRDAALLLWACAAVVLLLACVNLANLLLARASAREGELAVRAALGGGRGRLVRQLLTESLVIAALGGIASLALTAAGTRWIAASAPAEFPRLGATGLRTSVYLYSSLLTVAAALAFGLLPAWRATAPRGTARALRLGRPGGGGAAHQRVSATLIIGEIAIAVLLTISGGLLSRSFLALRELSPGFRTERIVVARINPPKASYADAARTLALYQQVLDRLRALPGVVNAAATNQLPIAGPVFGMAIRIQGQAEDVRHNLQWVAHSQAITPEYLDTFGVPVVSGRGFTTADRADGQLVALISQSVAKRYWPAGDAIGKRIGYPYDSPWLTIVGVVPDLRLDSLRDTSAMAVYVPLAQRLTADPNPVLSIAIRARGDIGAIERSIRPVVESVDTQVAVTEVRTMEDVVASSMAKSRFTTILVSAFALVAVLLGAIGIYGVMSYLVSQRTHELGVRAALGATPWDIASLVLRRSALLGVAGGAIGIAGALAATRALHAMLFAVSTTDPLTFAIVPLGFLAVALLATVPPARRATRSDPVGALRRD